MQSESDGVNHLANETSPYLVQHSHNPVDWYPWSSEAFHKAVREDKPIFLSIGYSSCHWCHVMAHESFENAEIAKFLNENYVSIKVDREERPEIDHIYMQAVQALTGRGGWPLSVFLTPDGRPFFGGTYFPPENRQGMPGFAYILTVLKQAYTEKRDEILAQTRELQSALSNVREEKVSGLPGSDTLDKAYHKAFADFDLKYGGFAGAPKFPEPIAMEFLLTVSHRKMDRRALDAVELTLDRMARGGIYDHVGGGFHRYSTDNMWRVPHFEKMLYDNALLSRLYLRAYQLFHKERYKAVTCETLGFFLRDMRSPEGGFYGALDADIEAMEGKYYLWSMKEIEQAVGETDIKKVSSYFNVTSAGNFERSNVLYISPETNQDELLAGVKDKMFAIRQKRPMPGKDEKIIASWNGIMLSSLSEAAAVLGRKDYLLAAISCADFVTGTLIKDGKISHTYKDGKAAANSYLEDYACLIRGLLDLHAASLSFKWLELAVNLADVMIAEFLDKSDGLLYDIPQAGEQFFMRPHNVIDGATPSGYSEAVRVLQYLYDITENPDYHTIAESGLASLKSQIASFPRGFANWLCALDFHLSQPLEIVVAGKSGSEESANAVNSIYKFFLPNKVVAANDAVAGSASRYKLLENKHMLNGRTTVYVCRGRTCGAPVTDMRDLLTNLKNG